MTTPVTIHFHPTDPDGVLAAPGRVAVFAAADGTLGAAARRIDRAARGVIARAAGSPAFARLAPGEAMDLAFPASLAAEAIQLVKLDRRADAAAARKAGAAIGAKLGETGAVVVADGIVRAADIAFGIALRAYAFEEHKSGERKARGAVTVMVKDAEAVAAEAGPMAALAEGVFFTRDLVNEPANVLTTDDFAARLAAMQELGLDVEILEEADLKRLGMRTLLAVGQGSSSPSKVVVMHWKGAEGPPLALIGKGVVFDTGGVSMKPA
ncbi:MAG: leucyl aminopeptidase, partial [Gemmobacter sp.]